MCGIAGIYAYHYAANSVDRAELRRIRENMISRGPDGKGEWYSHDDRLGLGHRQLSNIHQARVVPQPLVSADGNIVVVLDGDIYNYQRLRSELELNGRTFFSNLHAEVLLHLYAEKGEALTNHLRGMFAFGLWDLRQEVLLLARDHYGIKPLYYADNGWTLRFASQVKALLAGGKISRTREPAGLVGFCLSGSVPEPFTTYQEIRSVPAGSTLRVDRIGTREAKQYFSIADEYCRAEKLSTKVKDVDIKECVRNALLNSVQRHLAPGSVGAVLSGDGISAAIVGLIRDAGRHDIQTVGLSFEEPQGNRKDLVEMVPPVHAARHTTRIVTEEEFHNDLPKIFDAMDQPTIGGFATWFLSKAARELGVKVLISARGGDELFGGYSSFREVPRTARLFAAPTHISWLGGLARRLLTGFDHISISSFPRAYLIRRAIFMPWELESVLGKDVARLGLRRLNPMRWAKSALMPQPNSNFAKVAVLESSLYLRNQLLRDTDWASMAHSQQFRAPMLDVDLLRELAPITVRCGSQSRQLIMDSPRATAPSSTAGLALTEIETPIQSWLQSNNAFQYPSPPALAEKNFNWLKRWAYQVAQNWTGTR